MNERLRTCERSLLPDNSTGTPEKFIGQLGWALRYQTPEGKVIDSYEYIRELGLEMDHPRLNDIKRIFSRMTQAVEIMANVDPNFSLPGPHEPFNIDPETGMRIKDEFLRHKDLKITVDKQSFSRVYENQLRLLGIDDIADKLHLSQEEQD